MRVDIAWWELDGSVQTIESLRSHLRAGGAAPWVCVPGLRLKYWIADEANNRWGAVMLWETDRPTDGSMPPNAAADLIGYPPTHRFRFDVEAMVEGLHDMPVLHGTGRALC